MFQHLGPDGWHLSEQRCDGGGNALCLHMTYFPGNAPDVFAEHMDIDIKQYAI